MMIDIASTYISELQQRVVPLHCKEEQETYSPNEDDCTHDTRVCEDRST
jgi:hypothetical protein